MNYKQFAFIPITMLVMSTPVFADTIIIIAPDTNGVQLDTINNSLINSALISNSLGNPTLTSYDPVDSITNLSSGRIVGTDAGGIQILNSVETLINKGEIIGAPGFTPALLVSDYSGSFTNTGIFSGEGSIMYMDGLRSFNNSGSISGSMFSGVLILSTSHHVESFSNSGTIFSANDYAVGFMAPVLKFNNSGSIDGPQYIGTLFGEIIDEFTNTQSGSITGLIDGVVFMNGVKQALNEGTIHSTANFGAGILVRGEEGFITNTGTISGANGIWFMLNPGGKASVINSGTIKGNNGTAITFLGGNTDHLTLLPGSRLIGNVDFGESIDVLDFSKLSNSSVLEITGLKGETLIAGDNLYQWNSAGTKLTILNPASLMPAISENSSQVLVDQASNILAQQLRAPRPVMENSPPISQGIQNTQVWTSGFKGQRTESNQSHSVYGGIVSGSHIRLADARIGVFAGIGQINSAPGADVLNSETHSGIVGGYGQYQAGGLSLDFSLMGGLNAHKRARTIIISGIDQTANADFSSWFISPHIGIEIPILQSSNFGLKVATSVTYIGGAAQSYSETGNDLNLVVGTMPIHNILGGIRLNAQLILAETKSSSISLSGHIGLSGQSNMGGSSLLVSMLGGSHQNISTPASFVHALSLGAQIDVSITQNFIFRTSIDHVMRSNNTADTSGTLGINATF